MMGWTLYLLITWALMSLAFGYGWALRAYIHEQKREMEEVSMRWSEDG